MMKIFPQKINSTPNSSLPLPWKQTFYRSIARADLRGLNKDGKIWFIKFLNRNVIKYNNPGRKDHVEIQSDNLTAANKLQTKNTNNGNIFYGLNKIFCQSQIVIPVAKSHLVKFGKELTFSQPENFLKPHKKYIFKTYYIHVYMKYVKTLFFSQKGWTIEK